MTRPLDMKHEPTETEIIREAVNKAAEHCARLDAHDPFKREHEAQQIAAALYAIRDANEARDKSRRINVAAAMPDLSESVCRVLLEIGFDAGVQAVNAAIANNDPPVINPFRRSSTTIEDMTNSRAADGRCHANAETSTCLKDQAPVCASTRGFECDCPGTICKVGSR